MFFKPNSLGTVFYFTIKHDMQHCNDVSCILNKRFFFLYFTGIILINSPTAQNILYIWVHEPPHDIHIGITL